MIRLRIAKHDECHIKLEALEGIEHFGFGTFLCQLQPEEIECDEFSKQALVSACPKDGLNGLEIWEDNRLAWGDPSESIIVPIEEISNMTKPGGWVSRIAYPSP